MRFESHAPAAPLAAFVRYVWCLRDAPPHARERILPSGTLEIVINLREDEIRIHRGGECRRYSGAVVSGAYRGPFEIDARQHAEILGVHFRPGGASALLGVPAAELADAHADLSDLWGAAAPELRDRLCSAAGAAERFRIVEEALLARAARGVRRHPAVPVALAALEGRALVRDVARRVGLSQRRFIRVFASEVGLTPKQFQRVRRFRRALASATGEPDWALLAAGSGYADQSHLIRDFLDLGGLTPVEYLRMRGGPVKEHHVALAE